MAAVPARLESLVSTLLPGARLERILPLGPDAGTGDTAKVEGYGVPVRITAREVVFRTMAPNPFGHDRRADRADGLLLSYEQFEGTPDHLRALGG